MSTLGVRLAWFAHELTFDLDGGRNDVLVTGTTSESGMHTYEVRAL
jgi:hypothetical protein